MLITIIYRIIIFYFFVSYDKRNTSEINFLIQFWHFKCHHNINSSNFSTNSTKSHTTNGTLLICPHVKFIHKHFLISFLIRFRLWNAFICKRTYKIYFFLFLAVSHFYYSYFTYMTWAEHFYSGGFAGLWWIRPIWIIWICWYVGYGAVTGNEKIERNFKVWETEKCANLTK